ncbi:MAG: DUF1573 domain-containing protein [Flavobacteriales bacterium]|nr:DUF1573 domain-containing protein [Flavobacteriales bacterium]
MKKVLVTLNVITLIMVGGVFSNTMAQKATGPAFSADKMEVSFGEVEYKGDGTREYVFKNIGTEPLLITNAKGSCGCTVPEWPKEPIRPGQTGVVKIKYDTSRSGPISKSVTITTNEIESKDANGNPVYKNHNVLIKGNVKPAPTTDGLPVNTNSGAPVE